METLSNCTMDILNNGTMETRTSGSTEHPVFTTVQCVVMIVVVLGLLLAILLAIRPSSDKAPRLAVGVLYRLPYKAWAIVVGRCSNKSKPAIFLVGEHHRSLVYRPVTVPLSAREYVI